jgi:hypothetical protein
MIKSIEPFVSFAFFVVNKNRRDAATSPTTESEYKEGKEN